MSSYQNLFVTKLPRSVTDVDLLRLFAQYRPRSAKVMLNPTTGRSKGFGFVLFNSAEAGFAAYNALNGTHASILGQQFDFIILPSTHNGELASAESNALFVRNIPMGASEAEILEYFSRFGFVKTCWMRQDHRGHPVWVVFVEYEDTPTAKAALFALHGKWTPFPGGPAPMLAKFAESEAIKAERRRRREDVVLTDGVANSSTTSALSSCASVSSTDNSMSSSCRRFRLNPYSFTSSVVATE